MARGVGPGTRIKTRDQLWCSWGDEQEPAKSLKMCRLESGQCRLPGWSQMEPLAMLGSLCSHMCGSARAWLRVATAPIHSPALPLAGLGKVDFAPCDAVVCGASGVSRVGVDASPLIFLILFLICFLAPCLPAWLLLT